MQRGSTPARAPEGYLRTVDLIAALSVASDLAVGLPTEHSARSCSIAMQMGYKLGLAPEQLGEVYYTALVLDAGCTAWASTFASYVIGDEINARQELLFHRDSRDPLQVFDWARRFIAAGSPLPVRATRFVDFLFHGRELFREGFRNTCEVSNRFAQRLGMPQPVQQALLYVFEHWDGQGMPDGVGGDKIPAAARIAHVAVFLEISHRAYGRDQALRLAKERRGKEFDPDVVDAFVAASHRENFWKTLEGETILDTVRLLEPDTPIRFIRQERLLDVALFAADFADVKSRYTIGHSRRVAKLAKEMGKQLAFDERETQSAELTGLLHDLGMVAIPSFVLEKPHRTLTQAEREALRLHPYHAERIISRVPVLESLAAAVGSHHERVDGRGYYRGLAGMRIPMGARIIAVADAFDDLTHEGPEQEPLGMEEACKQMREEVGRGFDPEAFSALLGALGTEDRTVPRESWPAGLTTREVEVLRLAARGLTRKQIADTIVVSESTVRSHLEHIYVKIGVATRAAATLFAVEHDLVG
jgi:HD-GYP domain-containing protein (c-di-GMP phosphodiesterase class II)